VRTGERFGAQHVIDILRGRETDRVTKFAHRSLSTFGIGLEFSEREWKSIVRQLVTLDLLAVDTGQYATLHLTPAGVEILRGARSVELRREAAPRARKRRPREERAEARSARRFDDAEVEALWQDLRSVRRDLARANDVAPYVIAHDATLIELMRARPRSLAELQRIPGFGEQKAASMGTQFLDALALHPDVRLSDHNAGLPLRQPSAGLGPSAKLSVDLFNGGLAPDVVASRRGLATSTIWGHIIEGIAAGQINSRTAARISEDAYRAIEVVILECLENPPFSLRTVFDHFEGKIPYEIIRCVLEGIGGAAGPP
jgi:ATP-dependent DNA helicase RecQ